jgi:hypothetical protein
LPKNIRGDWLGSRELGRQEIMPAKGRRVFYQSAEIKQVFSVKQVVATACVFAGEAKSR